MVDDLREISYIVKLIVQFSVATIIVIGLGYRVLVLSWWFDSVCSVFWIVFFVNAFNFSDNMNGLATGLAASSFLFFSIIFSDPSFIVLINILR